MFLVFEDAAANYMNEFWTSVTLKNLLKQLREYNDISGFTMEMLCEAHKYGALYL